MNRTTLLTLCSAALMTTACGNADDLGQDTTGADPKVQAEALTTRCMYPPPADYSGVLGPYEGDSVTSTSPTNSYGIAGCSDTYVVEATNTSGKDLHVWASWAEGLPTTQASCESIPKVSATVYGFDGIQWVTVGTKTLGGTWTSFFGGGFCSAGVGWDFYDSSYSKVRIAAKAYQNTIYGPYYRKVTGTIEIPSVPR
jgi:hypothetical protein